MIVEERIYTIRIGKLKPYLETYEKYGLPVQTRILPRMVGYFTTEIGPLHTVVHMWAYEDLAERDRRRAELVADPDWQAYLAKAGDFIERQENRILIPTSFSPLK
ncbi:NIPSNAP family protein [Microbaculum marinum]|uniref:NIPSNAP family protein n=1 Tax=Microbaculum marinum TaxID=1764581 RepID=A0AAW9RW96_9HYPH